MKRCDHCGGTGYALPLGGPGALDDCAACNGSGWVDEKIQGPPPKKGPVPVIARGPNAIDYKPGDIHEDERGQVYELSERYTWERVDKRPDEREQPEQEPRKLECPEFDRKSARKKKGKK